MKTIVIVLATIVVSILLMIFITGNSLQPGALSADHKDAGVNCFQCHSPFKGTKPSNCMNCHNLDQIGQVEGSSIPKFHDSLNNTNCMGCHSLHADSRSWRIIPKFRHDFLSETIRTDCAMCHESIRPQNSIHFVLGIGNCVTCHTTSTWKSAKVTSHEKYFPQDSNHLRAFPFCNNCHSDLKDFSKYSCISCHENGIEDD